MVIFKKVTAKNFFSVGNQPIEIQLDRAPTTLVTGSNGAGKSSSILDTIYFALFGRAFRNITKPNIVNSINGGDLEVTLEFEIGKRQFKVVRGVKPNKFEIYQDGNLVDQDAATKDYQKHLEDNILGGLNQKVFKQVVIIGSADYKPFMQLSTKDRREVIEELLDIKIFSQMLEKAREKASSNREKLRENDYSIDLAETKIDMVKKNNAKQAENDTAKKQDLENKIEAEEAKISTSEKAKNDTIAKKDNYTQRMVGHDVLLESINDLQKFLSDLQSKKKDSDKTVTFFSKNDICPVCHQDINEEHKHTIVETAETKLSDVENAITAVKESLEKKQSNLEIYNKVKKAITTCDNEVYRHETDIASAERYIRQMKKEIAEIDKPADVDTSELKKLEKELEDLKTIRQENLTEEEYLTVVSNMLRDGGIKTKIIRQYVPIMNQIINEYLIRFGLPIEFMLDENFSEVIRSRHRDSFQYNNFSEGEKQRIDTALLLAWRQIAKSKNTTNTNLLIMDETFDSSLDASATEELLNMLLEMDSKTNIFIISHKADLSDKLRSHIEFEKHGNFTKIKDRPD